jgi:hypothetical protein
MPVKQAALKSALTKEPTKPPQVTQSEKKKEAAKPAIKRLSPGVYRNSEGQLVNAQGRRIDSMGRPLRSTGKPGQPEEPGQPGQPGQQQPPQEQPILSPTEQQAQEAYQSTIGFGQDILQEAAPYNPLNPQAGFEQGYGQQMELARQNVMQQFERTMQPEFARQENEFQQKMLEQGIDPNSQAFQLQYKQMKDAQENARLNAISQAFSQGAGYQQQGFEQQQQAAMLPFQQFGAVKEMYTLPYAAGQEMRQIQTKQQWEQQQAERQRQFERRQAEANRQAQLAATRMGTGATIASARIGAEAQMHGQNLAAMQGYQGQPSIPWYNYAAQGFATAIPGAVAGYMGSK